jgi:hypothetical protein
MQRVASLSSSEVGATTAANTLSNAATISHVNVISHPTETPTGITE